MVPVAINLQNTSSIKLMLMLMFLFDLGEDFDEAAPARKRGKGTEQHVHT